MPAGRRRLPSQRKWVSIVSKNVASAVQVAGLAAVTVGAAAWSHVAGWIVGGVSALVIGVAMERGDA